MTKRRVHRLRFLLQLVIWGIGLYILVDSTRWIFGLVLWLILITTPVRWDFWDSEENSP